MPKNTVICCDGTTNQFGEENSNVVKLYSVLNKEDAGQVSGQHLGLPSFFEIDPVGWKEYKIDNSL